MRSNACRQRGDDLHAFLRASARGFAWAAQHPGRAAALLVQHGGPSGPAPGDLDMVLESQHEMSQVRAPWDVQLCFFQAPRCLMGWRR